MDRVRDAISGSRAFMASSTFDFCERICSDGQGVSVEQYMGLLFNDYLSRQRGESYDRLRDSNRRERKARFTGGDSSTVTCSESPSSSVVGSSATGTGGGARVIGDKCIVLWAHFKAERRERGCRTV